MHVWTAKDAPLNATYSVVPDGDVLALIMESRGGGADIAAGIPGRNADYNEALDVLLGRLRQFGASILDALVDSRRTQTLGLAPAARWILSGPGRLAGLAGLAAVMVALGRQPGRSGQDD